MYKSFLIFYLSLIGINYAQNAPVILWGESTPSKPALHSISIDSFANLITPHLEESMVLVFLENDLEAVDLSLCKTESKESCFKNIKKFNLINYYADVELPVNALKDIIQKRQFVNLDNSGNTNEAIDYEIGKIVYVKLDDSVENRPESLSSHDSAIAQLYNKLSKSGKILGIYTSEKKYLTRKVRQAHDDDHTILREKTAGKFLIYFKKLTLHEGTNEPVHIKLTDLALVNETKTDITYTLSGSHKIDFVVHRDGGYWSITKLFLDDAPLSKVSIIAGDSFSYYCGTNEFRTSSKKILKWTGLQMEPNFDAKITGNFKFHDPWHCVGFTSPAIWMGIFVSFMFLFIISIGVTWLMDINTMDRFDDPKGKTITINASD